MNWKGACYIMGYQVKRCWHHVIHKEEQIFSCTDYIGLMRGTKQTGFMSSICDHSVSRLPPCHLASNTKEGFLWQRLPRDL